MRAKAARLWRTVRHLRPVQIYGRAWFRLAHPTPDLSSPPPLRKKLGTWQTPARRTKSLIAPSTFFLLNEQGDLESNGWDNPLRPKLWRYNQHYFDDLNATDASSRADWHQALIKDWTAANSPGQGTGWEPYPTSIRIVNWIKWSLSGNDLDEDALHSLAIQTRWLMKRLEWHLLGNHLFANAKALVFGGLFFDGPEAQTWLLRGLQILSDQIPEQVLDDGGHFELSPMYHALALEDILDIVNITQVYGVADTMQLSKECHERIPLMRRWLLAMTHPDGGLSFFNDAAFGVSPESKELEAYSMSLGYDGNGLQSPLVWLERSGYVRINQDDAVLIADLAFVGPDYLPGHAHADTLSFELSLFGRRVFTNSGTSVYGMGPERLRQRGTAAHNTVTLDGQDSSEIWGGFRVGRRAKPFDRKIYYEDGTFWAGASHDGFCWLFGKPVHKRTWRLSAGELMVRDEVSTTARSAVARYHLHPDVRIHHDSDRQGKLVLPSGACATWHATVGIPSVDCSSWHPEFGKSVPSKCLALNLERGVSELKLRWTSVRKPRPT